MKKNCLWCQTEFEAKANNQVYHNSECRVAATKEKIANYYRSNKTKRKRKKLCDGGCGTVLSRYNESGYCTSCMSSEKALRGLLREMRRESRGDVSER